MQRNCLQPAVLGQLPHLDKTPARDRSNQPEICTLTEWKSPLETVRSSVSHQRKIAQQSRPRRCHFTTLFTGTPEINIDDIENPRPRKCELLSAITSGSDPKSCAENRVAPQAPNSRYLIVRPGFAPARRLHHAMRAGEFRHDQAAIRPDSESGGETTVSVTPRHGRQPRSQARFSTVPRRKPAGGNCLHKSILTCGYAKLERKEMKPASLLARFKHRRAI